MVGPLDDNADLDFKLLSIANCVVPGIIEDYLNYLFSFHTLEFSRMMSCTRIIRQAPLA